MSMGVMFIRVHLQRSAQQVQVVRVPHLKLIIRTAIHKSLSFKTFYRP